jgi:hypothetical protein
MAAEAKAERQRVADGKRKDREAKAVELAAARAQKQQDRNAATS